METVRYRGIKRGESALGYFADISSFLEGKDGVTVVIPPGVYVVGNNYTRELQRFIHSGAFPFDPLPFTLIYPDKEIVRVLEIKRAKNVTVIADGVTLLLDGVMTSLEITDSSDISVRGLTVDYVRKPYTKCRIEAVDAGGYTVSTQNCLYESSHVYRCGIFDIARDKFRHGFNVSGISSLGDGRFYLKGKNADPADVGNDIYLCHIYNYRSALYLWNANGITLEKMTVRANEGEALIADHCADIHIIRMNVEPSDGDAFSTNTDALHLISCKGNVVVENCRFVGVGDDFINTHTFYHKITSVDGDYVTLELGKHSQSGKVNLPDVGDELAVECLPERKILARRKVVSSDVVLRERSKQIIRVRLDEGLPQSFIGEEVADVTRVPNLIFRNNYGKNGFARGVLVKSPAVIENNELVNLAVAGIKVSAEDYYWHEGITAERVTIIGNKIVGCGHWYTTRETGGIVIDADVAEGNEKPIAEVLIKNNVIECPYTEHSVYITGVKDIITDNNELSARGVPIVTD